MRTVTYLGPGGERRFSADDGFTVDLVFRRNEPTEIADANAEALLEGPHAYEFTEGAPETPFDLPEAPPASGAITDETGDVPGPDDDNGSATPAGSPNDAKEA